MRRMLRMPLLLPDGNISCFSLGFVMRMGVSIKIDEETGCRSVLGETQLALLL